MTRYSSVSMTYIVTYLVLNLIVAFASAVAYVLAYEWHNVFGSSGLTIQGLTFIGLIVVMLGTLAIKLQASSTGRMQHAFGQAVFKAAHKPGLMFVARAVHFIIDILLVIEKHLIEVSGSVPEDAKGDRGKLGSSDEKSTRSIEKKREMRSGLRGSRKVLVRKSSKGRSEPEDS